MTPEQAHTAAVMAGVLGVLAVVYLWSCVRHPYKRCGTCKGSGRHTSTMFRGAYRPCHECSGSGRRRRTGSVLIRRGERVIRSSKFAPRTYPKKRR